MNVTENGGRREKPVCHGGTRSDHHLRLARALVPACLALFLLLTTIVTPPAFAFKEGDATWQSDGTDCDVCHTEVFPPFDTRQGPHGNYASTTDKCGTCHTIHDAPAAMLLPEATIKATCFTCHDGSGGMGVYGTIAARGLPVGATHRIDTTTAVPGGDASTGGTSTVTFGGSSSRLSCDDCHSPHDASTVAPFRPERVRFNAIDQAVGAPTKPWRTSKLLRQRPTSSDVTATVYGSDWCLGCHRGRRSGGAVHNHPAESSTTTSTPFHYDAVAIVKSDVSFETTIGTMGMLGTDTPNLIWHNRGFVMPYPRTPEQAGHGPICQQCHEDSRAVGQVGAVTHAEIFGSGDGLNDGTPDVPRFQNFPHETQNGRFLVETYDDLCTNCHPVTSLP